MSPTARRRSTHRPARARLRRVMAIGVALACAIGFGAVSSVDATPSVAAAARALTITDLQTQHAVNPLGIDATNPVLSWKLHSVRRDQRETGYEVVVWGSDGRRVWDSGRVRSSSQQATYAGKTLHARQRYTWAVRVWNAHGIASASRTAWWEMGLLSAADWAGASWIGGPSSDGLPRWPAGSQATASTFHAPGDSTYDTANAIDGDAATFWNDDTQGQFPDWLQVQTPQAVTLPGVTLYTSTQGGPSDFDVATLQDGQWVTQRHVTNVSQAYTQIAFDQPVSTTAVRITVAADWEQDVRYVWTRIGELSPGLVDSSKYTGASPAPLLRTTFDVSKPVRQARLYISGLAYYQASIDGKRVGDSVLDPAFTMYDHRVDYATHDVTKLIRRGTNAIGVELGRGFYGLTSSTPWWNWNKATWHHEPELKAELVITYADGTTKVVTSGDSWQTVSGPRVFDSVYTGEDYDARRVQPGWDTPSFDTSRGGWQQAPVVDAPTGKMEAQAVQPIKITDRFAAASVTQAANGDYVFDFGRTTAGWASLNDITGPAGTAITMRYGEQMNTDGTVKGTDTYGGRPLATDTFTLRGTGSESWQPAFSWQSFRYVEVTGLPSPPSTSTMTGMAVHTAAPVVGSFTSSDAMFNQIHAASVRTTQNNMQSVLSDTPTFEKNGWMDDGALGSQFIPLDIDMQRFFEKWANDMQDAQVASGEVPLVVPSNGNGLDINYPWGPAPEWQSAFPAVVWSLYQNYADTTALTQHYDALVRYVDYELGALDSSGLAHTSLGDWVAPEASSDSRVTATAFVYKSTRTMQSIATVLGRSADAAKFGKAADALDTAFNTAFFQPSKGYYQTDNESTYRQATNAIPLAFGMVPSSATQSVADSLAASVVAHGNHLATGSLGTSVLLIALSRNGHADTARKIVDQTTFPSWGYWLTNGGDTLFESWDLGARSRDHLFLGAGPEQWFYEDVAGLRRTGNGWSAITVDPAYSTGLTYARATIDTALGKATSSWRFAADGTATLDVVVPVGSTAEVHLPATGVRQVRESGRPLRTGNGIRSVASKSGRVVVQVGSGTYHFVVTSAVR